ncbi:hypothetical protein Q5P01_005326 [Channa striata]|uniref:G-protein coupled receptors family 1 profile domain-containing protein n=1 Tax=Channa striata TaxID=64152 RepID=A0AA88NJ03_CHASR|nr:hypothetical protein Q5P01_005326 [Channa striata]
MENITSDHSKCHDSATVTSGEPIPSAVMFSTGVVGNIVALVLLEVRRANSSRSVYHVLVIALLMTDLLGSLSVSPVVLVAYARGKTLVGMSPNKEVCSYFGFVMTFLILFTLSILCVMALERYLSIGHPYFYERHVSKRCAYTAMALVYPSSMLFCVGPLLGFGKYVQYCPGTWCFLEMSHTDGKNKVYIGLYASFILVMILSTVVGNVCVIVLLAKMYRRGKMRRSAVSKSMTEEMEHLLPLALVTVVFICCTFPTVLQVYLNFTGRREEHHSADLGVLRLLSAHSIINPWVFIILRPSVLRILWRKLHKPEKSTFMSGKTLSCETNQTGKKPCSAAPESGV